MEDKRTLLHRIRVCDFILNETALFLDTHPDCTEALEYYQRHLVMQKEAHEKYVAAYGPLNRGDYQGGCWKWVDGPWPWENV